jgi:isoleucyl-tRNA synthetase
LIPFTAEEAWRSSGRAGSVHQELLPQEGQGQSLIPGLKAHIPLRSRVNEKLEEARRDKKIGKSLEAYVELTGKTEPQLTGVDLEELFIVSKVVLKPTDGEETITVTRAEEHGMKKCIRCWKYWDHVGSDAAHPELCERCTQVVLNWQA